MTAIHAPSTHAAAFSVLRVWSSLPLPPVSAAIPPTEISARWEDVTAPDSAPATARPRATTARNARRTPVRALAAERRGSRAAIRRDRTAPNAGAGAISEAAAAAHAWSRPQGDRARTPTLAPSIPATNRQDAVCTPTRAGAPATMGTAARR